MSRFPSDHLESSVRKLREGIFVFPPKDPKGVVSWWLDSHPAPVLIDCPELSTKVINDLKKLSGKSAPEIILTNRNSHGEISLLCKELGWPVIIQEQESYLLPDIETLHTFEEEFTTTAGLQVIWTPGPTPGSCIAYASSPWNVLFCGRLLIPVAKKQMDFVRTRMTFHWTMQQKSIKKLRECIPLDPPLLLASSENYHLLGEDDLLSWDSVRPVENG